MAALRTWVKVGLIPHARHGGSGVWTFAVAGSKLDGTGLENVQMVHTQVAVLGGGCSTGGGLSGLSDCCSGEDVPLLDGAEPSPGERDCNDVRLEGLGMSVTLAEDFRNPACGHMSASQQNSLKGVWRPYVELVSLHIFQVKGDGLLAWLCFVDIAYPVRSQVDLSILLVGKLVFAVST
jgi:hypothetical protein